MALAAPVTRPRLLDLFCGAGGAAMGYHRAGFDVVGVDINPQPHYPFEFWQEDALGVCGYVLDEFDAVHASPPCQAFTNMGNRWRRAHVDLLTPTLEWLRTLRVPYVVENVPGAAPPLRPTVLLHGSMFGLGVHRPRLFESNVLVLAPRAARADHVVGVYGDKPDGRRLNTTSPVRAASSVDHGRTAMGIDWMTWSELTQAIPPAYTEHIGRQLLEAINGPVTSSPQKQTPRLGVRLPEGPQISDRHPR